MVKRFIGLIMVLLTCQVGFGQLDTVFNGYGSPFRITSDTTFQLKFINEQKTFSNTDADTDCILIVEQGGRCYTLPINEITSTASGNIVGKTILPGAISSGYAKPAAILRPTETKNLYPYISGLPDELQSCIEIHNQLILDTLTSGASSVYQAEQIRDSLNSLIGSNRLDVSAIKNDTLTKMINDSIIGYYVDNSLVGQDTIRGPTSNIGVSNFLDTTVVDNITLGNYTQSIVRADVNAKDVVVSIPTPSSSVKGNVVYVTQVNSTLGVALINTDGTSYHFLDLDGDTIQFKALTSGVINTYKFTCVYDAILADYYWQVSDPEPVIQGEDGKYFVDKTYGLHRIKFDLEVDSVEQVIGMSVPLNSLITVKYTNTQNAYYLTQANTVTGYTADSIVVIPVNNGYAKLLPSQDNEINIVHTGSSSDYSDNRIYIQKAIDYAIAINLRKIYIPADTFNVTRRDEPIAYSFQFTNQESFSVRGAGKELSHLRFNQDSLGTWYLFNSVNSKNLVYKDFGIVGRNLDLTFTSDQIHGIRIGQGTKGVEINNVRFHRTGDDGIFIIGNNTNITRDVTIKNCFFEECGRSGISCQYVGQDSTLGELGGFIEISNNIFYRTNDSPIDLEPSDGPKNPILVNIHHNKFYERFNPSPSGSLCRENSIGGAGAAYLASQFNYSDNLHYNVHVKIASIRDINILNNQFYTDTTCNQAAISSIKYVRNANIQNNIIYGDYASGMVFQPQTSAWAEDLTIIGNEITLTNKSVVPYYISVSDAQNVLVMNNRLKSDTIVTNAIVASDNSGINQDDKEYTISHNTIYNSTNPINIGADTIKNISIQYNHIKSNIFKSKTNAITLAGSPGAYKNVFIGPNFIDTAYYNIVTTTLHQFWESKLTNYAFGLDNIPSIIGSEGTEIGNDYSMVLRGSGSVELPNYGDNVNKTLSGFSDTKGTYPYPVFTEEGRIANESSIPGEDVSIEDLFENFTSNNIEDVTKEIGNIYLDSVAQISARDYQDGDIVVIKSNQAVYVIQSTLPSGFTADNYSIATTNNSKYAILQPGSQGYKLEWFDVVNDTTIDHRDQIQKALQWHSIGPKPAPLICPPYEVRWSTRDENVLGARGYFLGYDNMHIIGHDSLSIWKVQNGDTIIDAWFFLANIDNVVIEGMTFDGNKQNTVSTDEQTHIFNLSGGNCTHWRIYNSRFNNNRRDGFKLLGVRDFQYRDCFFDGNQRSSIVIQRGCEDVHIENSTFKNGGDGHVDFEPTGADTIRRIYIKDNIFENFLQGAFAMTLSSGGSTDPNQGVWVTGNTFLQGGIGAYGQLDGYYIKDNIFRNEIASNNTDVPFDFRRNIRNFEFSGNTIYLTDSIRTNTFLLKVGPQVTDPRLVEINNNKFLNVDSSEVRYGIIRTEDVKYVDIKDNRFEFGPGDTTGFAISVAVNNDADLGKGGVWNIIGNQIIGSNTLYSGITSPIRVGIRNDTLQSVTISDNRVTSWGQDSISLSEYFVEFDDGTNGIIKDLTIKDNIANNWVPSLALIFSDIIYKTGQNSWGGDGVPSHVANIGDIYHQLDATNTLATWFYTSSGWIASAFWGLTGTGQMYSRFAQVGINTETPAYQLHVNGDGLVSGRLTVGSTALNSLFTGYFRNGETTRGGLQIERSRGADASGTVLDIYASNANYGNTNGAFMLQIRRGLDTMLQVSRLGLFNKLNYGSNTFTPTLLGSTLTTFAVFTDNNELAEIDYIPGTSTLLDTAVTTTIRLNEINLVSAINNVIATIESGAIIGNVFEVYKSEGTDTLIVDFNTNYSSTNINDTLTIKTEGAKYVYHGPDRGWINQYYNQPHNLLGFQFMADTINTVIGVSDITVTNGDTITLDLTDMVILEQLLPFGVDSMINRADSTIMFDVLDGQYGIRVQFDAQTATSSNAGVLLGSNGAALTPDDYIINRSFTFPKGTSVVNSINMDFGLFASQASVDSSLKFYLTATAGSFTYANLKIYFRKQVDSRKK